MVEEETRMTIITMIITAMSTRYVLLADFYLLACDVGLD
jgi:hypothetical protein